jgi:phosphopantothenoylcysteine decarboxylase/phosphopantothenate--cysteine ligase
MPGDNCSGNGCRYVCSSATQKNITTLRAYGNYIIEAENGELASGLEGKGRMQEPEVIVDYITTLFSKKKV